MTGARDRKEDKRDRALIGLEYGFDRALTGL